MLAPGRAQWFQFGMTVHFFSSVGPALFERAINLYSGHNEIKSKGLARERKHILDEVKYNNTAVVPVSHIFAQSSI